MSHNSAEIRVTHEPDNNLYKRSSAYIVLIHGLDGNYKSFTNVNTGQSLQKLLELDFPSCTIITYSYPNKRSNGLKGSRPFNTIRERAKNFLQLLLPYINKPKIHHPKFTMIDNYFPNDSNNEIVDDVKDKDEINNKDKKIPIIFIAHSMGGLISKCALTIASDKNHPEHSIYLRFKGIIFLYATPHRGSGVASLYKWLPSWLPWIGPEKSIDNLRQDDHHLVELMTSFNKSITVHPNVNKTTQCILSVIEHQDEPIYNGYVATLRARIVDEASAVCFSAHEKSVKLDYYHTNICKPESFHDPRYTQIAYFISTNMNIPYIGQIYKQKKFQKINIITNHFKQHSHNKLKNNAVSTALDIIGEVEHNKLLTQVTQLKTNYSQYLFYSKRFLLQKQEIIKSLLKQCQHIENNKKAQKLEEIILKIVTFGLEDNEDEKKENYTEISLFNQWKEINNMKVVISLEIKNLQQKDAMRLNKNKNKNNDKAYVDKEKYASNTLHIIAHNFNSSIIYDNVMN